MSFDCGDSGRVSRLGQGLMAEIGVALPLPPTSRIEGEWSGVGQGRGDEEGKDVVRKSLRAVKHGLATSRKWSRNGHEPERKTRMRRAVTWIRAATLMTRIRQVRVAFAQRIGLPTLIETPAPCASGAGFRRKQGRSSPTLGAGAVRQIEATAQPRQRRRAGILASIRRHLLIAGFVFQPLATPLGKSTHDWPAEQAWILALAASARVALLASRTVPRHVGESRSAVAGPVLRCHTRSGGPLDDPDVAYATTMTSDQPG